MIWISTITSNTCLPRYQSTWMIPIAVFSTHCCRGQNSCQQNAEKRRKQNPDNSNASKWQNLETILIVRWLTFKWAFFMISRHELFTVYLFQVLCNTIQRFHVPVGKSAEMEPVSIHPNSHQIYHWIKKSRWSSGNKSSSLHDSFRIQALPANQIRIKISPTIQLRLEIEKFYFLFQNPYADDAFSF